MDNYYSNEPDILELVALIKAHGINKAIVSPGSTNISFAASLLYDSDIKVYSCVDERSAAYMACGLAAETGEPVVISCTGATAARNYAPALTEAFYRKLPILAVTSSQHFGRVGQYIPQVTDRTNPMNDIFVKNVQIPIAHTNEDRWSNNVKINDALLELRHNGGGPVHINIETSFSKAFDVKKLPDARVIRRINPDDKFPDLKGKRIGIFVGSHSPFDEELTKEIDKFCACNNAVVVCDQTSNYKGEYRVLGGIVERQAEYNPSCRNFDLVIHIGELSGAYYSFPNTNIWRVNPDGVVRDTFKGLSYVFEMSEKRFFEHYNNIARSNKKNSLLKEWRNEEEKLYAALGELPFSNVWIAQHAISLIPENSEIHFGILNSLRMWNLFDSPKHVYGFCNVGGFGIDGSISTVLGASLADENKLFFLVLGDLATFYDLNTFGNRHFGNNVRIMVVNNGTGFEMRHSTNRGDVFKEDADILFAAGGHFGNKSRKVLRDFVTDLGCEYISCESKEEVLKALPKFCSSEHNDKSIVMEVFVSVEDEYDAYERTRKTLQTKTSVAKATIKNMLGEKGVQTIKKVLHKM